jgi:hypothetical protein
MPALRFRPSLQSFRRGSSYWAIPRADAEAFKSKAQAVGTYTQARASRLKRVLEALQLLSNEACSTYASVQTLLETGTHNRLELATTL